MPSSHDESRGQDTTGLPRLPAALIRVLVPDAERDEVLSELSGAYGARVASSGRVAATVWLWRQVLASAPALARRNWWRGWSGFQPRADWSRPGGAMFEGWAMDFEYALRRLRKRPTYTVMTVLTLSLGVAGTAAVYTIAQRLLWESLPIPADEEVAVFWGESSWSQAEFLYMRPELDGFHSVAAFWRTDVTLQEGDAPATLIEAVSASAELFQVLGVSPIIGPGFQPGDDIQGGKPVVVLSHSLWRELGGDPSIVGQRIDLSGVRRTVVGVMPAGFWFPDPTVRVWLSMAMNPEEPTLNYRVIGRLAAGTSVEAMGSHVGRITTLLGERFTYREERWDKTQNAELTPLRDYLTGSLRPALLTLLGAMALILLIACVNVTALMLGQVDSRGTELAVRAALGAARQRLLRQLVVESLVIGALSGLAGTGLALLGFRFLTGALPLGALADIPSVDWALFWAAIGLGILAATVVALVPAVSVARSDLQARLSRSRTRGIASRGSRLEAGLVVMQVALVLLMISGAALLIRSVANLRAIDRGVEVIGVGVIDVVMSLMTTTDERSQIMRELVRAMETVPGVASAAASQRLPLRGSGNYWPIRVEQRPELEATTTAFRIVSPDYFETMGIHLRSGRGLLETDRLIAEEGIVVINEELANRYLRGMDPIGQRIAFTGRRWDRIVGIVDNVTESELTAAPEPARYILYEHAPGGINVWQTLVFRTQRGGDAVALLDAARRAIEVATPSVAVQELTTMEHVLNRAIGPARQIKALLSLLGGLGLVLGVVGVYGVVSHFVTRRRREWGIRIALGMRPSRVIARIVGGGGALVSTGIAIGLVAFLALGRLLTSFLYGVDTADIVSMAMAGAVLLGAGLFAAYIPARRASRIDPAMVLREE